LPAAYPLRREPTGLDDVVTSCRQVAVDPEDHALAMGADPLFARLWVKRDLLASFVSTRSTEPEFASRYVRRVRRLTRRLEL
jgi:hypothetical protein